MRHKNGDVGAETSGEREPWSWAATDDEVEERRRHVRRLAGHRIRAVRYYMIDYRRGDFRPESVDGGPRFIDGDAEWEDPAWRYDGFDAVDHGVEFETESGLVFSLTWDPPGDQEGIGLRNVAMLDAYLNPEVDVAIWSVGDRGDTWAPLAEAPVTDVQLHYYPWEGGLSGFWCPHITFHTATASVQVVLGDANNGTLDHSSDNIAVLHPATSPLDW
ncbi:hypothetical protein F4560_000236 [Saccharothrix ecbatanensis]|uniref:Uncharacterized protein n=1 Tax=Saccharothrix ecbatanensis TaxID=1105145 RepID=A0A7W9HEI2_9PSEU|nr:hypothetical protein [Saccharothrix ecbatanensis]MBB5800468.1 hypothetical protein [Saccharothrix ecbatanensis]